MGSVLGFAVMSSSAPPVAQYLQCWLLRFFFFSIFFFILIIFHLHLHFTYLCDFISFYLHSCTKKCTKICLNWREDIHSGVWEMQEAKSWFVSLLFFFILLFEKPRQASPTGCPRYFLTRLGKIGKEIQGERRWKAGRLFHNKVLI